MASKSEWLLPIIKKWNVWTKSKNWRSKMQYNTNTELSELGYVVIMNGGIGNLNGSSTHFFYGNLLIMTSEVTR